MRIAVHVTPKSGRDEVVGWRGGELSVRVTAPPEGGKANEAAVRTIAEALDVPRSHVRVVRGEVSRHKQVEVEGVGEPELVRAFGERPAQLF